MYVILLDCLRNWSELARGARVVGRERQKLIVSHFQHQSLNTVFLGLCVPSDRAIVAAILLAKTPLACELISVILSSLSTVVQRMKPQRGT